jgi:hypothetical protein
MIQEGFCHCGCGEKTNIIPQNHTKNGYVKGEYYKYIKYHNRRKSPVEYIVNEETDCWEWQRAKNNKGYGHFLNKERKTILAHRFYYEKYKGFIPQGFELDHICHNPGCVNPEHLRLTTKAKNCMNKNKGLGKGSSKYKGVFWHSLAKKWQAGIGCYGEAFYLGLFLVEEDAARAYDKKAKELFGEFACLNFKENQIGGK